MSITNTDKPSAANITNTSKVLNYETWDSNTTTWATETRTWDQMNSFMTNTSKPSNSITNLDKPV